MRRTLIVLGFAIAILAIGAAVLFYTGAARTVLFALTKPNHGWDLAYKAPAPDYSKPGAWAALPGKSGPANLVPAGVAPGREPRPIDVFFVHPTGYLNGHDWNSPLAADGQTEENTRWMMANQASVFNGCCEVYAPRYREASIFTYLAAPGDVQKKAMDFAYADVVRAFEFFLAHDSARAFIIASHSQGTAHAFRLIKEKIDGTSLAQRLVAAYLLGGGITNGDADALKSVHACANATDLHCIVHWATWGEGGTPSSDRLQTDAKHELLCVNPLSWLRDGPLANAVLDRGGVPVSGRFSIKFWGSDTANGATFPPLHAPIVGWSHAACRDGLLWVADQSGGPFGGLDLGGKNYHGLDYPLFAMDIRENAIARVSEYFASPPPSTGSGR